MTESVSIPLPYGTLKTLHNTQEGRSINPFFGQWKILTALPYDFSVYRHFLDTLSNSVYTRPIVTESGLTHPASYFVDPSGQQISLTQMRGKFPRGAVAIHADTCEAPILIAVSSDVAAASPDTLAATAYKTLVSTTAREVEPSDRQVHWVWFRRSPTWRLTEEIILRAASWIELNPGFQFHLWTNLANELELADFLADLPASIHERYFHRTGTSITVHYASEFRETIFTWLAANTDTTVQEQFAQVWASTERQDIVMKTDYTRNILLAVHGGIYADFNDLLCLAPIEPLLAAHAGSYVGVSDNITPQSASNYFMYAARGNLDWNSIVIRCTQTLPEIREAIYDSTALETAQRILEQAQLGYPLDLTIVQSQLDASLFRDPHIQTNQFLYTVCMAAEITLGGTPSATLIRSFLKKNSHGRAKVTFPQEMGALLAGTPVILPEQTEQFARAWRFARTDMYLRQIMHRSNLPIFCREQSLPIYRVPFSYLLRYSCLLSFVGHLGDGTSYGMDPHKRTSIRRLLGLS